MSEDMHTDKGAVSDENPQSATEGSAEDRTEQTEGPQRQILLLISHGEDRTQLASFLSEDYEIDTMSEGSIAEALTQCDLCVADPASVARHREHLEAGKERAEPVFFPYVLVTTDHRRGTPVDAWTMFDDIVETPVRQAELQARVETLFQTREYSLELTRQNQLLENFTTIVSHDLRNPLNVAQLRLDLAQEECTSEHLSDISRAHTRMESLIDDVLTLAREGGTVAETERIALVPVITQCWETVDTRSATLVTKSEQVLRGDPSRLRQLFENLIRNAIEHGGPDVTIEIGALPDKSGFYVQDDGAGISPTEQSQIFDRGYTTSAEGTGFGLAIVQEIAHTHEWTVSVSTSQTGGARFEIADVEILE